MNRVLIVTGASRDPGIGSAVAKLALAQDWNVVTNGRSEPTWNHSNMHFVQGDITEKSTQKTVVDTAVNRWGRIDGVVHNAALSHSAKDPQLNDWINEYKINVVAPYELTILARDFLESTQGSVVMIGSRSGVRPYANNSIAYSTSKSAQHYLAKELAVRLAPIRVNAVAPGLTLSVRQMEKWRDPNWKKTITQGWEAQSRLPSYIKVEQVAEGVLYLLNAKNTTGTILDIDNGVNI